VLGMRAGGRARGPHARTHDADSDTYSISRVVYLFIFFLLFFCFVVYFSFYYVNCNKLIVLNFVFILIIIILKKRGGVSKFFILFKF
jgi:hypothetical protein